MESGGWLVNQCLALSPNESRNNISLSASCVTPLYLTVPHTSMKFVKCMFSYLVDHGAKCSEAFAMLLFSAQNFSLE